MSEQNKTHSLCAQAIMELVPLPPQENWLEVHTWMDYRKDLDSIDAAEIAAHVEKLIKGRKQEFEAIADAKIDRAFRALRNARAVDAADRSGH